MTNYSAHEIFRLDQAYPAAVNTIEDLTGDPTRKTRLAEVGPKVFAAELTRDLAASAAGPMSLAAWAAVATVRLMDAGRMWEEDTDKAWAKVDELTDRLAAMTEAATDHRKTASNALNRGNRLHEQLAAAQNALRSLGQAHADLKTDNDELVAENARVRQQRDELKPVVEAAKVWRWSGNTAGDHRQAIAELNAAVDALPKAEADYLIWSQHHRSWWGPSRSGYRSNPADAGRYTLTAAQAEMGRGCYCCRVPEVPVAAGKVISAGDQTIQAAITEATEQAIAAGQENKAYDVAEATR
ncbi:hypothetical protein MED01_004239 [Micromonospora sp. MED01]|uniref:hypothetical protein n=1 Tax=Micromonospora alfalfae TaxID=2911212 RepID=UPI001EE8BE5F|nr:hypothetical protein [Micromonospora alfalfae]MCG5460813.1 hypothetical protein [Micromonospora alfalfae]